MGEQAAEADRPESEAVIGRYPAVGFVPWFPVASAFAWILVGILLHSWWFLAMGAGFVAIAATVWLRPRMVISDQGVRIGIRRFIPWSQVVEVVSPPNNGWKQPPPELVLGDGRRQPLELPASQVDALRALARQHGSPIPP
jgi:hypothetical protein